MKTLILLFLVSSAMASQNCEITGYNTLEKRITLLDHESNVSTWQDCYRMALQQVQIIVPDWYVHWEFNEAEGYVNSFTTSKPKTGDQALDMTGKPIFADRNVSANYKRCVIKLRNLDSSLDFRSNFHYFYADSLENCQKKANFYLSQDESNYVEWNYAVSWWNSETGYINKYTSQCSYDHQSLPVIYTKSCKKIQID